MTAPPGLKPTKEQIAACGLYANILEEIKHRIAAIDTGTMNRIPVPAPFVREFCYLQLRMICELVALGCLVAHGDIQATQKMSLQKEWSAETIIKALADLHPDFFPLAYKQKAEDGGFELEFIHPPVMTKDELLNLYGRCGGVLHRGTVKKLLKQHIPVQLNHAEITAIAQKLVDLLSMHSVVMLGGKTVFLCLLRNANDNMKVQVAIAQAGTPPELQEANLEGSLQQ
jgi:hypothetical protein